MSTDHRYNSESKSPKLAQVSPRRVSVSLQVEKRRLAEAISSDKSAVFLDTNILIWSFGLNERASAAWQRWLQSLGERLVIPSWVVHEYNQHSNKPEVTNPYKSLYRTLEVALNELRDCASRALDERAAVDLGCSTLIELERKLQDASAFSSRVAKAVSKNDQGHRTDLLKFYEDLLDKRAHLTDIYELSQEADREFNVRAAMRLSPGGEDAEKPENRCGDLIIWKEILQHCALMEHSYAVFVSNDVKRDWCYAPPRLILENGKEVTWSSEAAQDFRLPNPELLTEFQLRTGRRDIVFATIDQVIATLASTAHNTIESVEFRELAQALRTLRTPTDQAVDWIHRSEQIYKNGLTGPASWEFSPSEVDMDVFEIWCRDQMKDSTVPLDKVNWMQVFLALYI